MLVEALDAEVADHVKKRRAERGEGGRALSCATARAGRGR